MSVNYQVSVAFDCMVCFTCNPSQKVWYTLGNVIQFTPPLPPGQCWMLKDKIPFTLLQQVTDLNFDQGGDGEETQV